MIKNLIIPEYKIILLNKNKKVIDVVENLIKVNGLIKKDNNKMKYLNQKKIVKKYSW